MGERSDQDIIDSLRIYEEIDNKIANGLYQFEIRANDEEAINYNFIIGENIVKGDSGDTTILATSDLDILFGGLGLDLFDFSNLAASTANDMDIIMDFEQGEDLFDFSGLGLEFGDLSCETSDGSTVINDSNSDFEVQLNGEYDLIENDFMF
ncbi:MAG: hypothetical protein GY817_07510 [bacterium]|nr:hypothetical protein [bacterium]